MNLLYDGEIKNVLNVKRSGLTLMKIFSQES